MLKPIGPTLAGIVAGARPTEDRKVIPHPTQSNRWTICVTDDRGSAIYGAYDRRELAVAVMLTN